MSKPATETRLTRAAEGFTQVIGRGNAHIITKNPTTGKCCFDAQVGGGWHYNGDQETDTAWTAGVAPWNFQMVKANYNVFALSQFNQGQIIKWVDPTTGQNITFQPAALQWTNSLNQIQQISMPQAVAAQASDDILYWPAAYGAGRNFRYQANPLWLNKQLIIDSPSALPATTYDTLELNFIISVSSGVNIMVDGAAWDKRTTKNTANAIAFRLPDGTTLWSFAVPRAWDSSGLPEGSTTGSMRLKKQGSSLYISVRFPKAWIDSITQNNYPIIFDPTVDYQINTSANDGHWFYSTFTNDSSSIYMGTGSSTLYKAFIRFVAVTIPDGSTIDVAYLRFYYSGSSGTPANCDLYAEKAANPNAVSSASDGTGRTKTAATIKIQSPTSGTWWTSNSIISIVEELLGDNSYAAGAAVQFFIIPPAPTGSNAYGQFRAYNYSGNASGPKLHIEYTEVAAGGASVGLIGPGLCGNSPLISSVLG